MKPRRRPRRLARFWRDLRSWGDPVSRDLSTAGELLVAKARVAVVLLLLLIPVKSVVVEPALADNWIGLGSALLGLAFAALFLRLAGRVHPPPWLGMVTSQFDVAAISAGSLGFVLAGNPLTATNSLVHYSIYFLALSATGLRYDPRISLAAGAAALAQHGAIALWVGTQVPAALRSSPEYGTFDWDNQIGRLQVLLVATLLEAAIVVRSRRFWLDSMRDRLTGLYNRRFFEENVTRLAVAREESREPFSVALADLDHFKTINDTLGHAAGDAALCRASDLLRGEVRGNDVVGRYGGEELALLLVDLDRAAAAERMEECREALAEDERAPRLTVSVGVATFPADGTTLDDLVAAADRRLYAAKRAGRNRVVAEDEAPAG